MIVTPYKDIAERNLSISELRVWLWICCVQTGQKRIFLAEISDALGLHRSAVTGAVKRLREKGMLQGNGDGREYGKVLKVVKDPRQWKPDEKRRPAQVQASGEPAEPPPAEESPT